MEYRKEFENEINDRAAWRAGLLHRFTDTEGMARSRIACKETEQAGYKEMCIRDRGCILCGLIQTNNRYFELFQTSGGLDAEITDHSFQRYYHSGDFPQLSPELRAMIINRSFVQEQGIRINHIPIRGGHLFWSEDISVLLDQYQDIREQQEELTARNRLLKKTYHI